MAMAAAAGIAAGELTHFSDIDGDAVGLTIVPDGLQGPLPPARSTRRP